MDLKSYFQEHEGTGVLATANIEGDVNVAVYATPHVIDDTTIAFIMRPRLSLQYLRSNPQAAYLYMENRPGYHGKRLYLRKLREEEDMGTINALRRRSHGGDESEAVLVYFTVERVRALVGDK